MGAPFTLAKSTTIRGLLLALPLLAATSSLGGCFGVGMVAHKAVGDKNGDGAGIVAAQEQAITSAHGGASGAAIAWSDKKTGTQGTLQRVSLEETADGCNKYNQALDIGTETTHGVVKMCRRADGSWHLQNEPKPR
jgi:surface antigen